jgi:hypothetical protein
MRHTNKNFSSIDLWNFEKQTKITFFIFFQSTKYLDQKATFADLNHPVVDI